MKQIYIYGASGHGLVVADIARACGYEKIIFVDDGDNEHTSFDEIEQTDKMPLALGVGNNNIRAKLFEKVKNRGFEILTLIHPSSIISPSAVIGAGAVIMPNVAVNAKAIIGDGAILNTGCIIEHECVVEDFVHISPNAALAGNVKVGKMTHIGIGSCVIQGINIGTGSVVGAGSVVIKDIGDFKKAYGNPCKETGENE